MTTPPPDDLRADAYDSWQSIAADMERVARFPESQHPPLSYWKARVCALAALSALPAGGEWLTPERAMELVNKGWEPPEPRPVVAALCKAIIHGDTTPPADADVGAQGEDDASDAAVWTLIDLAKDAGAVEDLDDSGRFLTMGLNAIYALEAKLRYRNIDPGWALAAPAAGKGVDGMPAKWRAAAELCKQHEVPQEVIDTFEQCADELEAALTRQPVAGDGWMDWMRDREEVVKLAEHLEDVGWRPGSDGAPECFDQGAAMAADVMRRVLLPMLAAAPPQPERPASGERVLLEASDGKAEAKALAGILRERGENLVTAAPVQADGREEVVESLYCIATNIEKHRKQLPDEWQDWIAEVAGDIRNAREQLMTAALPQQAGGEDAKDAARFVWWFTRDHTTDEIVELTLRAINKNTNPSLDEWRAAIDAAIGGTGDA